MEKDPNLYPEFDEGLSRSMRDSIARFMDAALWDEGNVIDALFLGDFAFVNTTLPLGDLLSGATEDPVQQAAFRDRKQSVIDFVKGDFDRVRTRVGSFDRMRLDQHLAAVRDIERRIQDATLFACREPEVTAENDLRDTGRLHTRNNVPYVLGGSAGGVLRTGRFLELDRSHNDFLLTLCHAYGIEDGTFGDPDFNTGSIGELF